ncbi:hypothetical protein [uncultured Mucilaginibacter sp.]|uniref:hypothetical protein n=1 Tax=uncultured Mucilaginibacter sp. TaxID=797541 RepID=UPI0025FFEA50|nr:hypothetical protein [uncultured Mucilaginibacter sp.]
MDLKKFKKLILVIACLPAFTLHVSAQNSQNDSQQLKKFKEHLASIDASFVLPEGFTEVKPENSDKTAYEYALTMPNDDFEIRFQVNDLKREWKKFQRGKSGANTINPDSLYSKIAMDQVNSLSDQGPSFNRPFPARIMQFYNVDIGHSYFFSLANNDLTKHYQYALLVVIQKNHYGTISVVCLSNEKGPEFFKKINKLRNCLKFNG